MKIDKNNISGIVGAAIGSIIVLLILLFVGLTTLIPEEEDGLMLVNIGNADTGFGASEPAPAQHIEQPAPAVDAPQPEPQPNIQSANPVETQSIEESLAMAEEKKKKEEQQRIAEAQRKQAEAAERKRIEEEKRKQEEQRRKEEEERKRQEELMRKQNEIAARTQGAFESGNSSSNSEGIAGGTGNQGNPFGDASSKNYSGSGSGTSSGKGSGSGKGNSYSLGNRKIVGDFFRPSYNAQEEGTVVVNITVDKQGNVIGTSIGKGTSTSNRSLIDAAFSAARKTKFDGISTDGNQYGTITYHFELK